MTRASRPCAAFCGAVVELPDFDKDPQRMGLCIPCRMMAKRHSADRLLQSALAEARAGRHEDASLWLRLAAALAPEGHVLRGGGA